MGHHKLLVYSRSGTHGVVVGSCSVRGVARVSRCWDGVAVGMEAGLVNGCGSGCRFMLGSCGAVGLQEGRTHVRRAASSQC